MNAPHPFEAIAVDYRPADRPEHIVEDVFVLNEGDAFRGHPHIFIDGVDSWTMPSFPSPHTWADITKWHKQTKAWRRREAARSKDQYDAVQIARLRRVVAFGSPEGTSTVEHTGTFEAWLMDNGWRPVMLDNLCAQSPGRILFSDRGRPICLVHTHVYIKGDRSMSMQFGYGNYNLVFTLSEKGGTFQVPVNSEDFPKAVRGELKNIDA